MNELAFLRASWPAIILFLMIGCVGAGSHDGQQSILLARHQTIAEFEGIHHRQCRHLTSLCPDRCGHSGNVARFRILQYLYYAKPGEYGDPETSQFAFMIEDNQHRLQVSPELRDQVASLVPGDTVLLFWNHNYVTANGASYPERPVVRLEKLTDLEQQALIDTKSHRQESSRPMTTSVRYRSADNETVQAVYDTHQNTLTLTTATETITLPSVISASGARYASPDGQVVFWSKGALASYWKNGELLFKGVEEPQP